MECTLPDLYEVEKIINCKYFKNKKYYLIKWLCYPINQSTWEPKSNLKNLNYLIEKFEAEYPSTIDKNMYTIFCNEIKNKTKEKKNKQSINSHMKYLSRKRNFEKIDDSELEKGNLDRLKMHLHIKIDETHLNNLNNVKIEKQEFFIDLSDGNNNILNSFSKEGNESLFEENTRNIHDLIKPIII